MHVTLNPVCTNVCQSRFNGGRPVWLCVARRAWSGLESRKSRQRSKTMNSYSANVASEISMRARNVCCRSFRGGNGAVDIFAYLVHKRSLIDIISSFFLFFFSLHHSKRFFITCVYLQRPIIDPNAGRKREREARREREES